MPRRPGVRTVKDMSDENPSRPAGTPNWGLGIALGVAIGFGLGMALRNPVLGIGIGLAIGVAFAYSFATRPPGDEAAGDGSDTGDEPDAGGGSAPAGG